MAVFHTIEGNAKCTLAKFTIVINANIFNADGISSKDGRNNRNGSWPVSHLNRKTVLSTDESSDIIADGVSIAARFFKELIDCGWDIIFNTISDFF